LLGHHPESDKIDKVLKRAYDAQRSNDWTLIWAVNKELSEFK
jgi:hypothetical protein